MTKSPLSLLCTRALIAMAAMVALLFGSAAHAAPQYQTVAGAGGVPLAVVTDGPDGAPPILFIHGLAQSSLSWNAQFNSPLALTHKLVAFDLRGHGASGKPWAEGSYADATLAEDVTAVMSATGVRQPLVVAWSYGTYVINDYVRMHGAANLSGIIYIGATGGIAQPPVTGQNAEAAAAFNRVRQSQTSPDLAKQIEGARLSSAYLFKKSVPDDVRERSFDASLMLPAYARTALYGRRFDSQGVESSLVGLPLLFLGGREDGAYAGDVAEHIQRSLPQAKILLYDGVGHSPFLEDPARFNADVEAFASAIAAQAHPAAHPAPHRRSRRR